MFCGQVYLHWMSDASFLYRRHEASRRLSQSQSNVKISLTSTERRVPDIDKEQLLRCFPRSQALYLSTIAEVVLFTTCGAIVYAYTGGNAVAPAYGTLNAVYGKVAAGWVLPSVLIVAVSL